MAQVWCRCGRYDILIDQFRERCDYREFRRACRRLIKRYRPSAILIEPTAQGPALRSDLSEAYGDKLAKVSQPNKKKTERLARHLRHILKGHICLLSRASCTPRVIEEFVNFPNGDSDDVVDAAIQYFEFMETGPVLYPPQPRAACVRASYSNGRPLIRSEPRATKGLAVAVSRRRRFW